MHFGMSNRRPFSRPRRHNITVYHYSTTVRSNYVGYKTASTVEKPFLKPNCASDILLYFSHQLLILLLSTAVKTLDTKLTKVIPRKLLTSFSSPFLNNGIIISSVHQSGKYPLSNSILNKSVKCENNISPASIEYKPYHYLMHLYNFLLPLK